jgi:cytoskeletal protein CcmA (bactofilin family)
MVQGLEDSGRDVELLDWVLPRAERRELCSLGDGVQGARSTGSPGKEDTVIKTAQDKRTIVEEGTSLQGTLESACPILVNGRVDGDVRAPSVVVSNTGAVQGVVQVGKIQSSGELCGKFDADHVELTGSVKDNTVIRAKSLEIKLAAKQGKMQVVFSQQDVASPPATSEQPPQPGSSQRPTSQ